MEDAIESPRRACDQCRTRKIRCDKLAPCSNCRTARRDCSSTGLGQKPKEVRQRVLISHQYERKIDDFSARLGGIESLLRDLSTTLRQEHGGGGGGSGGRTPSSGAASSLSTVSYYSSAHATATPSAATAMPEEDGQQGHDDDEAAFEGGSSMAAHAAFATEFVARAVADGDGDGGGGGGGRLGADVRGALERLRALARGQRRGGGRGGGGGHEGSRFAHQLQMPRGGVAHLPMPAAQAVLSLLREIKVTPPMAFMMSCTFVSIDDFIEACRKVYFATEDYSLATFIIANAGLYYLFQEKAVMGEGGSDEFFKYHYQCRDNLETALANMPLLMAPRKEMVEALLLGVAYTVEISKPSLAWQLNSAAVSMCLTLGWHRAQPPAAPCPPSPPPQNPAPPPPPAPPHSAAFWFCYMLDKGLSLRLGRPSAMQDWDISAPRDFGGGGGGNNLDDPAAGGGGWRGVVNAWIRTGAVLGDTYAGLYSPAALALGADERADTAAALVARMRALGAELETLSVDMRAAAAAAGGAVDGGADDGAARHRDATLDMVLKSGRVGHLSSLTLIYRAIPGPRRGRPSSTFSAECIEAARLAFEAHAECMQLTAGSAMAMSGYLNWTILYAPFTPFIVLFCHAVETADADDLARLEGFAAGLQPALAASPAVERLHRLCRLLCHVAALYVEGTAKAAERPEEDADMMHVLGNDFDVCLSQLGLMPQALGNDVGGDGVAGDSSAHTAELGDWFSGNRYVMGLVEEDLLDFDIGMWS